MLVLAVLSLSLKNKYAFSLQHVFLAASNKHNKVQEYYSSSDCISHLHLSGVFSTFVNYYRIRQVQTIIIAQTWMTAWWFWEWCLCVNPYLQDCDKIRAIISFPENQFASLQEVRGEFDVTRFHSCEMNCIWQIHKNKYA